MIKRVVFLAVFIGLVLAIFALWYRLEEPQIKAPDLEGVRADLSLEGIELAQGSAGKTEWKLKADNGRYSRDEQTIFLKAPRITYFRGNNSDPVFISGPEGRVDRDKDTAYIFPQVNASVGPSVITAQNASYFGVKRKILLSGGVRVIRNASNLRADDMEFFLDEDVVQASGNVRAVLNMTEGK